MGCIHKFFVLIASVVHDQIVMSDVHRIEHLKCKWYAYKKQHVTNILP